MEKIKIGFVGTGMGMGFMRMSLLHPDVDKVVASDMNDERRLKNCGQLGIESYHTMDEMLSANPDLNCVGIFTERHVHGKMIIDALKKGLNVLTAVPLAVDPGEIEEILSLVKKTRLTCMVAETCAYFPDAVFCREMYKKGEFGKFVFGQAAYYHDISEFDNLLPNQRGIPPMFYSTHSMSMLFGAIADYPLDVCCFGERDALNEGIFEPGRNLWDNPFANETAIFHMSKGGIACINEYRRLGKNKPSSLISCLRGTKSSYDTAGRTCVMDYGTHQNEKPFSVDVSGQINTLRWNAEKDNPSENMTSYFYSCGYSPVHDLSRLPQSYRDLVNEPDQVNVLAHNGSYPFLMDDFVRAVMTGKLPLNNAWESATYILPGLTAHESALRGGETMKVPYLGDAPADWARIDYADRIYEPQSR